MIVNRTTHGRITWNETWRGEIRIIGDIIVDKGYILTIEPGTKVLIAANSDIENLNTDPFDMKKGIRPTVAGEDPFDNGIHFGEPFLDEGNYISILIFGTLHAAGTPDQMITITSDSPNPGIYDWDHFRFDNGVLSYTNISFYRALFPWNGTTVAYNNLHHVGDAAIACANNSMLIEHNTISYAGHELIDMHGGSPTIRYNTLGPNPTHFGLNIDEAGAGIIIDGGAPQIKNNSISGCNFAIGFVSPAGTPPPTIENNEFTGNGQNIMINGLDIAKQYPNNKF